MLRIRLSKDLKTVKSRRYMGMAESQQYTAIFYAMLWLISMNTLFWLYWRITFVVRLLLFTDQIHHFQRRRCYSLRDHFHRKCRIPDQNSQRNWQSLVLGSGLVSGAGRFLLHSVYSHHHPISICFIII